MNERDEKKAQFAPMRGKSTRWLIAASLALCLVAVAGWWFGAGKGSRSAGTAVQVEGGRVLLPLASVSDGQAHFFSHQAEGVRIGFFVLKTPDGSLRAAFDACDVCYKAKRGYRQQGAELVCNNCEQTFPVAKVGLVSGGCNPAPLSARVVGDRIEIAVAELERGAGYFR